MELYELKDNYKNAKDGQDFINKLIVEYSDLRATKQNLQMIYNKSNYILGAIDALYFMNGITQEQYTAWYKYFGL